MKSNINKVIAVSNRSPSTRREWIEIPSTQQPISTSGSPSTRREWIEIQNIHIDLRY